MQKKLLLAVLVLNSAVFAAGISAVRAADAHVHGQVLLNIAVDGTQVSVELESPAVNLLGFEHSPATPEEIALVERVGGRVRDYNALLSFPDGACMQKDVVSEFLIFGEDDHGEHAHEHEEEADHEHAGNGHGDVHLRYQLQCRDTEALEVVFSGFGEFPGITAVTVQWLHASGQGGAVLTLDSPAFQME